MEATTNTDTPSDGPQQILTTPWMVADAEKSGISTARAAGLRFFPVDQKKAKAILGVKLPRDFEGYAIPFRDPETDEMLTTPDGRPFIRIKTKSPIALGKDKQPAKYLSPKRGGQHVYILPEVHTAILNGSDIVLTEGEKKAIAATDAGIPTVGLCGNWGWSKDKALLDQLQEYAGLDRKWTLIWDSDAADNHKFRLAEVAFANALSIYGRPLYRITLPGDVT